MRLGGVLTLAVALALFPAASRGQTPLDAAEVAQLAGQPHLGIFPATRAVPYPGPATAPRMGEGTLSERLAMLVGIDRYDPDSRAALASLRNAEKDARDVGEELRGAGFHRWLLTGSQSPSGLVTRNQILNKLSAMLAQAAESETRTGRPPVLLFYFAGHGITHEGIDYLIPSDFDPNYAEDIPAMAISIPEIRRRLEWTGAALYIVLSDACRSGFTRQLTRRSRGDESVTVANDYSATGVLIDSKAVTTEDVKGSNDSLIAFATLKDRTAGDLGKDGENGAFASAFLASLRKARSDAQAPMSNGRESDIVSVLNETRKMLNADSNQKSETVLGADRFLLYPTAVTFKADALAWQAAVKLPDIIAARLGADFDALSGRFYCQFREFLITNSHYGYYAFAAQRRMRGLHIPPEGCSGLKTTGNASFEKRPDRGIERVLERQGSFERFTRLRLAAVDPGAIRLAQQARPALPLSYSVGDVLNAQGVTAEAKAELKGFDERARIDDIGVVSVSTTFYEDPVLRGREVGRLRDGDLVQILELGGGSASGPTIHVRTTQGRTGYVEQKVVDTGRSALAFKVDVDPATNALRYDSDRVQRVLSTSILSDAVVQFRAGDEGAFLQATNAAAELTAASLRAGNRAGVVPKLSSVRTEEADKLLAGGSLRVAMTLLPLRRSVRQRVASVSGSQTRASDALDLALIDSREAFASSQEPDEAAKGCEAVIAAARSPKRNAVASYVQFRDSAHRPRSESARQVLRSAGFSVPSGEQTIKAPDNDEIRVCADQPWEAAVTARKVLDACAIGDFKLIRIGACRQINRNDAIEIWLGRLTVVDRLPAERLPELFGKGERRLASDRLISLYPVDKAGVVRSVVGALQPERAESYRINIYVARTLAGIRGGWEGSDAQKAAVEALRGSASYRNDETFRQNVDRAVRNHRTAL